MNNKFDFMLTLISCVFIFFKHLFDFVGSDGMATEVFSIQRARLPPVRSTTTGRIIDYINESCTVFVTWDDVIDITDIDVRLV